MHKLAIAAALVAAAAAVPLLAVDPAPLPKTIREAKSVFLLNQSSDMKVFDNLYDRMRKWSKWRLVEEAQSADLVLVFTSNTAYLGNLDMGTTSTTTASATQIGNTVSYSGQTRTQPTSMPLLSMPRHLVIVDPKTKAALLDIECERRIGAGYTAGVLVNRLKKRFPKSER